MMKRKCRLCKCAGHYTADHDEKTPAQTADKEQER